MDLRDLISKDDILGLLKQQQQLKEPHLDLDRLALCCRLFGSFLELSPDEIAILEAGAYLHDVGHLLIDDGILRYPGKLNLTQWEVVKAHTSLGVRVLEDCKAFAEVMQIVELHHERVDGTGYPRRLSGGSIPRLVQVFALCDVWCALISERPHRPAYSISGALCILREQIECGHHEQELGESFLEFVKAHTARCIEREMEGSRADYGNRYS